jgi:hypothetical protein
MQQSARHLPTRSTQSTMSVNEPDESHIELAQYRCISLAPLEEKLSQYPRGTACVLQRSATETGDFTAAVRKLMEFATLRGLSIKERSLSGPGAAGGGHHGGLERCVTWPVDS